MQALVTREEEMMWRGTRILAQMEQGSFVSETVLKTVNLNLIVHLKLVSLGCRQDL